MPTNLTIMREVSVCLFVCLSAIEIRIAARHGSKRSMAAEGSQGDVLRGFLFASLPDSRRLWLNNFSRGSCDAIFLRLLIRYRNPHRRMPQFEMLHGCYAESGECSKRVSVCLPPLQQKIVAR